LQKDKWTADWVTNHGPVVGAEEGSSQPLKVSKKKNHSAKGEPGTVHGGRKKQLHHLIWVEKNLHNSKTEVGGHGT